MRVETGVRAGDAISPFYDPMIAKLVVHAGDRKAALDALVEALEETEIAGSITNIAFLAALGRDADFAAGDVDTGLIGRKQEALTAPRPATARDHRPRRRWSPPASARRKPPTIRGAPCRLCAFPPLAPTARSAMATAEISARVSPRGTDAMRCRSPMATRP